MVTLYVVLAGLFAIVPPKATGDPVTALLLRVDRGFVSRTGHHVPPHYAYAFLRPAGYDGDWTARWSFDGESLELSDTTGGSPKFARNDFVALSEVVGRPVTLMAGCNAPDHESRCQIDGLPAIIGRVSFKGGSVRPLNIRTTNLRDGGYTVAKGALDLFEFQGPDGSKSDYQSTGAAGMVYEATFADLGEVMFSVPGRNLSLELANEERCLALGTASRCVIVSIFNSPLPEASHGEGPLSPLPLDLVDVHFEAFYRILSDARVPRFLPRRRLRPTDDQKDPPESLCIETLIEEQ